MFIFSKIIQIRVKRPFLAVHNIHSVVYVKYYSLNFPQKISFVQTPGQQNFFILTGIEKPIIQFCLLFPISFEIVFLRKALPDLPGKQWDINMGSLKLENNSFDLTNTPLPS